MKLWTFRLHTGNTQQFVTDRDLSVKEACDVFMHSYAQSFDTAYGQELDYETDDGHELHIFYKYDDGWQDHFFVYVDSHNFEFEKVC